MFTFESAYVYHSMALRAGERGENIHVESNSVYISPEHRPPRYTIQFLGFSRV